MSGHWQGSNRRQRLPPGWITRTTKRILERDQHMCQLRYDVCIGHATEVDHIQPGDNHTDTNLQAVCTPCHAVKSGREGGQASAAIRAQRYHPTEAHPGLR